MEIPFQGQFNLSILRRVSWAALRPSRGRRISLSIFAILFFWGAVGVPLTQGGTLADLSPLVPFLASGLLLAGGFLYALFVWGPKKQLTGNKLLQGLMTGQVGEEGILFETPYTKSDLPWDVFTKAKSGKDLILLYHFSAGGGVHAFPREFFANDQDWNHFVDQIRERVPPAPTGRREALVWLWLMLLCVAAFVALFIYNVVKVGP